MDAARLEAWPLRRLAEKRDFHIGAAVGPRPIQQEPLYREVLAREFNMLTPENAFKLRATQPERGRYDFTGGDVIVEFAREHGMKVRGHTLVWHIYNPKWVDDGEGTIPPGEWPSILRDHIHTVAGHYRGRVYCWDVVNEAIEDATRMRDSVWLRQVGPDYVEKAFRWAHEADPEAKLFYNDFGIEAINAKSDGVYALLKEMLQRGVPVHGVGLQMHVDLSAIAWMDSFEKNVQRFSKLGLEVHVTELDVRLQEPVTSEMLAEQARLYREILSICMAAEGCNAVVMWGFTDRHSWIPAFFRGYASALPFDREYAPKPAYDAIRDVLIGR